MRTKMAFENTGYWIKDYKMYRKQENGENFVVLAHNKRSGMWATWECTNGNNITLTTVSNINRGTRKGPRFFMCG